VTLRHTSISRDPTVAADQNSENARDANDALGRRVTGRFAGPFEYVATGDGETRIPVYSAALPQAVMLIRVQQVTTNSAKVATWPDLQFTWDGKTATAYVFEPDGLTSGAKYLLTFLVLE
jgi:hypothetical protein